MRRALLLAIPLLGCNVMEPELLPEHACERVEVAGTSITAADSIEDDASAAIHPSLEPWTVDLPSGAPGFVRMEIEEDASAVLFLGTAGVVQSLSYCDCPVPLHEPAPNGYCTEEIPEHYHLDLWPGVWHLELLGTGSTWLMLAPLEHAHEH
jgi:hypothetical protein